MCFIFFFYLEFEKFFHYFYILGSAWKNVCPHCQKKCNFLYIKNKSKIGFNPIWTASENYLIIIDLRMILKITEPSTGKIHVRTVYLVVCDGWIVFALFRDQSCTVLNSPQTLKCFTKCLSNSHRITNHVVLINQSGSDCVASRDVLCPQLALESVNSVGGNGY